MKYLLSLGFLFTFTISFAQFNQDAPWMSGFNTQSKQKSLKFDEVVNAFNVYWENRDPNIKGSGYKPFKRWETFWANYVKEDGTLPTSLELWNTYLEVTNNNASNRSNNIMVDESNWLPVGPFSHTNTGSWSPGQGRINVVVKDPNNDNIIYAGAPAGGLWKSTDAGLSWITTTDNLPQIGVSGIAIDSNNSDVIYIATGDDDAGDSYSVGVMKSIDGGLTWNTTGLNPNNAPSSMNDIYINPNNSNMLWVATNNGVFKTTDAGVTWTNINGTQGFNVKDIKIKPQDPNVIYIVTSNSFYRSVNAGDTFTIVTSGLTSNDTSRYVIDVTPANPNVVYVLGSTNAYGFKGVYKSSDSGVSFLQVAANTTDVFESTQSWFDMAFAVSDTNENEFYTGVLNIWKGVVNGTQTSFTKLNNWSSPFASSYSHADIHYLRFFDDELYAGTDGGFYKSSNKGLSFTDLTAGMQISQFYRVSVSKQTSNKMVGGLQDNGGHAFNNGQWQNYYGADGMDTAIDPANSSNYYGFIQNGSGLYVSTASGSSLSAEISAPIGEDGNWITPLAMSSDSQLYSGFSALYRLENNNWVAVSPSFGTNIDVLEIDPIDVNNIYVATNGTLRKSTDSGVTFTSIQPFSSNITSIEVNNTDNNIVYVTTSGTNGQVFKSVNGGISFTDISNGLPNVTKNSIKHQDLHSKNPLYLGTSLGVYRYDDDTLLWELFNIGLPNVAVTDIEINTFDNKITAATYGRGVWQSEIPTQLAPTDVKLVSLSGISDTIDCSDNVSPQAEIRNNGINTITSVDFTYYINGVSNNFNWTGNLASEASIVVDLPQLNLSKGNYTFKVSSTVTNDEYEVNNNSEEKIFYVNDSGIVDVVNTFETQQEELLVLDDGSDTQYWQRGIPNGLALNNTGVDAQNQVYGTNLNGDHDNLTKSYLVSQCYDLSILSNPELKFDMAFQLEDDWDIVYMEYSSDQGLTWNLLGSASDLNWYTSATTSGQNNTCFNCPGGQWTGTNPQYANFNEYSYDLSAFNNETNIMFRFVFHSDQSVVEEGAIVDNFVITGNVLSVNEFETASFLIHPNPSKGIFNIKTQNNQDFDIDVYDITGKNIVSIVKAKPQNTNFVLDLSSYSTGVYIVNIMTEQAVLTKKLIVN